jgi:pyruvate formate lyase activating enzyme
MNFGGLTPLSLIDFPGKTAGIVYTIGCNFRCPYCHNPELVDETVENIISEEEVLLFLKKRQEMLDGLVITGGEPTLHGENLLAFIKKVKDLGFLVKLDSNGTNPDILKRAIDEKLINYIAMDIKSPLVKYSNTVGRPVNIEAIKESIELLKKNLVPYEFRTTVIKSLLSPEDIEQLAEEISGAKRYFLQKFIPTKTLNPQFKKKVTYTDEEFKEFQKKISKHFDYCGIR